MEVSLVFNADKIQAAFAVGHTELPREKVPKIKKLVQFVAMASGSIGVEGWRCVAHAP